MQSIKNKKIYTSWQQMKQRCTGTSNIENNRNYHDRGISFDHSWTSFDVFFRDMQSSWRKGLTLDRIDNNRGYSKDNCRWATRKVQAINRRNTRLVSYMGQLKTLTDWSPIVGVARSTLAQRLYSYKWSIEKTLSTPVVISTI